MNYYAIGQRIRKYRKALGLSQEELAEKVNISVTHMSHIETGNTKLSLPVFSDISLALNVTTESLLFGEDRQSREKITESIASILEGCSTNELNIIAETISAAATALKKYGKI